MRKLSKKTLAVATTVVLLSGGGAAFAYWTNAGSGIGTAATGTSSNLTIVQTSTPTGLAPGSAAQPLDFTVTNPGSGSVQISGVVIAFAATTGCFATDFNIAQATFTPKTIAAGASTTFHSGTGGDVSSTGAAINMVDTGVNQNSCKSASVNLTYTSN